MQKRRATDMSDQLHFSFQFPDFLSGDVSFPAESGSCVTDDAGELQCRLREIESAMLGPDNPIIPACPDGAYGDWAMIADAIAKSDVRRVLVSCAKAVAESDAMTAQWLIDELRRLVSVSGDPMQRLGAYMLEGLVARLASSGAAICRFAPDPHALHELCPYFKFAYMSANGAIADAMKTEPRVHIVDFRIGQGSQWVTLIQAFAGRPDGPPRIRITSVGDGDGLALVGKRLARLAKTFNVPFEFCAVSGPEGVSVRAGEAVAVNFAFALHYAADESVSVWNRRDGLLQFAKGLSPRVVTVVEQEANTNTAPFFARFVEALEYYGAVFGSMDGSVGRDRMRVEQQCLAREVVNVVACEGAERVERHELHGKWRARLGMAGFRAYPLSGLVNATVMRLLQGYSNKYRVEERDGALYLGWMDRFLVTSSAWQ